MNKFREVFNLAAPLSAAQLAQSVMIFCDTVLFGLLGVEELAGGGLGSGIYHFLEIVVTGIFAALSTEVAIYAGQKKPAAISRIVKAGLILSVVISVVLALLIQLVPGLLVVGGQDPVSIRYAEEYLSVAIWISFPAFAFLAIRGLAAGMGYTTGIMRISVLAVFVNVPLSYALMTGWGWFPQLGLAGVALGTVISSFLMLFLLLIDLWQLPKIKAVLTHCTTIRLTRKDFLPFWTLGIPIALAWTMEAGVFTAATLLAGTISVTALAAHQIALQSAAISFNIYIGFAQGAAIRTGQCYGQHDITGVRQYALVGLALVAVFCLLAAAVFILTPEPIIALFTLGEEGVSVAEVSQLGVSLLLVAAFFQLVDGGQVVMMMTLRSMRMGMPPTFVAIIGYWAIGFPVAWFLMEPHGIVGIWLGLGLGLAFACVSLTLMFWWKINRLRLANPSLG